MLPIPEQPDKPNEEPTVLLTQQLQVGDIILSSQKWNSTSWLIRTVTHSPISHAAMHVGGGFLVEAVGKGIRKVHGRRFIYSSPGQIRVLRHSGDEGGVLFKAAQYAKALVYRPYSVGKAICSVLPGRFSNDVGRFCSELVYESLMTAGVPLSAKKHPAKVTPAEFLELKEFEDKTHALTRSMRAGSLDRALRSFGERKVLYGSSRTFSLKAEDLEDLCCDEAEKVMRKHKCFRRPFSYFDVLRQLADQWDSHRSEVLEVDQKVSELLREKKIKEGDIAPRENIPGLLPPRVQADSILPMWDAGETAGQVAEFIKLADDLVDGREWDLNDITESLDEMRREWQRTKLQIFELMCGWLLWDHWYAQNTYQLLDGIANGVVIPFD